MASNGLMIALVGFVVLSLGVTVLAIKRLLVVVMPNELVVIVGRRYRAADGRVLSYRVLTGGRVFRFPLIERVIRIRPGAAGGSGQRRPGR